MSIITLKFLPVRNDVIADPINPVPPVIKTYSINELPFQNNKEIKNQKISEINFN